jgi:hypothetical protein
MQQRKVLAIVLLLGGAFISTLGAQGAAKNTVNVQVMDLFESFEENAQVYECSVVSRKPSDSGHNLERGKVTLAVIKTLHGTNRQRIDLRYVFVLPRRDAVDGPMIWPDLDGATNLLCVIVPGAQDLTAYPQDPAITEAASIVFVVDKERSRQVSEMEAICKLYEAKDTPKDVRAIKNGVDSPLPTIRNFALKIAILKLGETDPEQAIKIIQYEALHYLDHAKHAETPPESLMEHPWYAHGSMPEHRSVTAEAEELIGFINGKFRHMDPMDQRDKFLCRCLATLPQSPSKFLEERAVAVLASHVLVPNRSTISSRQYGLSASEQKALLKVLESESKSDKPKIASNAAKLKQWLSN